MSKPAVFFDRDDTLIRNVPYNGDPGKVELLPGAFKALNMLKKEGFELIIISNQSGVGRGLITPEDVDSVNREMIRQLGFAFFSAIYVCYAAPEQEDHNCRKPHPGMVWQARDECDLNLDASFFVGDKLSDILCGKNAGCRSVLILHAGGESPNSKVAQQSADFAASSLPDAAKWIIQQSHPRVQEAPNTIYSERNSSMISKNQVYRCAICANMVEVVAVGGGTLVCCGQPMTLQVENTSDGATEKHVPVVEKNGTVKVTVGSVLHPMLENHYIQWIEVITASKVLRKYLKPGEEPVAVFSVDEPVIQVREYCNLHGLWSA
jgi:desulfoferrodoxin